MGAVITLQALPDSEPVDAITYGLPCGGKQWCGLPVIAGAFDATVDVLTSPVAGNHARAGRTVKLHEHEQLRRAARRRTQRRTFETVYRQDGPMIERSIAWLTGGDRKLHYRGVANNDRWLHHRAAGLTYDAWSTSDSPMTAALGRSAGLHHRRTWP